MKWSYIIVGALLLLNVGVCPAQSTQAEIVHPKEVAHIERIDTATADSLAMEHMVAHQISADSLAMEHMAAPQISADSLAMEHMTAPQISADSLAMEHMVAHQISADSLAMEHMVAPQISADSLAMEHMTAPQISADSLAMESGLDSLVAAPVKRSFFRKIKDYFKDSNKDKTHSKKLDFSIIGGPYYTSDIKFGIGLVAAGLYRTDRTDSITQPSNISLFSNISTSGFWMLGVSGTTLFKKGKHRLDITSSFSYMPTNLWGIGYDMGKTDANKSEYNRERVYLELDYMHLVASKLYMGVNASFSNTRGKNFSNIALIGRQKKSHTNLGVGAFLLYDSRDIYTDPSRGWYFRLHHTIYPGFMGNKPVFNSTEVTLDYYHTVWKGGVLAYDFHTIYNSSNTPWTMLAQMGGSNRMRGYYKGRYQDKALMEVQVELRQRIWRRIGVVAWVGAGNIFSNFSRFDPSHTLPTYGVGARWEFKKGVNVRLDYGIGKGESGFIFSINEAF